MQAKTMSDISLINDHQVTVRVVDLHDSLLQLNVALKLCVILCYISCDIFSPARDQFKICTLGPRAKKVGHF